MKGKLCLVMGANVGIGKDDALHPGVVRTNFGRETMPRYLP